MKLFTSFLLLFFMQLASAGPSATPKTNPKPEIFASCTGEFLGIQKGSIMVTFDKAKLEYKIIWKNLNEELQVLDQVKKTSDEKFELQCMNAKQASELKVSLVEAEGIHDFLNIPKNQGILCYFIDEVTTKCWSPDKKKKMLIHIGGWQT